MRERKKISILMCFLLVVAIVFNLNLPKKVLYNIVGESGNQYSTTSEDYGIMPLADPIGITTTDFATLKQYLESTDGNEYHMHLSNDITITETIDVVGTKEIYLWDYSIINGLTTSTDANNQIHIPSGATLTVRNGTFNGSNKSSTASSNITLNGTLNVYGTTFINSPQGIHVSTGGILNFNSGTIKQNSDMGIGAYGTVNFKGGTITGANQGIHINGGKLNVTGGSIYSNKTGIYISNSGTATVSGGSIYSSTYGATTYASSTLTVSNGNIYNNTYGIFANSSTTKVTGGSIYQNTHGIYQRTGGTATVSGGKLYDNTTNGIISTSGTTVNVNGGEITGSSYGIRASGNLNITKGSIYGNTTVGAHVEGGGTGKISGGSFYDNTEAINITNSTATISNGNIYDNNHGIVMYVSTVTMSGGSVYNNSSNGAVSEDSNTFNFTGGSIYSNGDGIDNKSDATVNIKGGSLYSNKIAVYNAGTLTVTAGTFKTNTATNGSAIYLYGGTCTVTGGTFESDQNIYLESEDLYVTTNTAYPSFTVKPATYTRKRVLVKTSGSTYANTEISNVTLYPNSNWYTRVSGSNIVLWDKTTVTAKYQDAEGNTLADSVTTEGWAEASYTTSAKDIEGYILTATPANATGTYADTNTQVVYVYQPDITQVEVKYIDQVTGEILDSTTIEDSIGVSYTTEAKTIEGYELVVTPNNATGTTTEETITVTYEYRKLSTVTVNHIDLNTNTVLVTDSETLKEGDTYISSVKELAGYENVSKPEIETITVGNTDTELTYGYRKTTAGVDVKYVDQVTGTEIATSEHLDGLEGVAYSTAAKTISGYELVLTPSNASGTYTVDKITVTYEYRKLSTVTVNHIDLNNNDVLATVEVTLKEGESYTASVKTFDGYQNVTKPENETITVGNADTELTYGYKKTTAGVDAKYIDQVTGTEIATSEHLDGLEGASYTTSAKTISGYELVVTPSNATGTMTVEKITVTYEYRKLSTLTINHIDANSGTILDTEEITLKEGDTYTAISKAIDGYTVVTKPDNETITMGREDIELTYEYKKTTGGVTVKYIDQVTQKELVSSERIEGLEGETYTTSSKNIDGYELVVTPSNATGAMTVDTITVTYEYRKLSTVTVKHIDLNTNSVITTDTATLKEGETYTATVKTIDGYTNVSKPDSETITIGNTDTELTYGYRKNTAGVDVKYVDQVTGAEIATSKHLDGLEGIAYSTSAESVTGYELVVTPNNAIGTYTVDKITVTYEYRKLSKVTVKHVDLNTNSVITTEEVTLKEGDSYTSAAKTFDGYTNVSKPENETITVGNTNTELTYGYRKTTAGVDVKYVDQVTGTEIATSEHLDGLEGIAYNTNSKTISGYELVLTPSNATGTFTVDKITVTYQYRKLVNITVNHIDENSNQVLQTEEITLKEGDTYTASVKDIDGYVNTSKPNSETIIVGNTDVELTYGYKKTAGGVDVRYIDQSTQEDLLDIEHLEGVEGATYTTSAKTIDGYELVVTPSNANGTMTVDTIAVTYEYRKLSKVIVKHIDANTNTVLSTDEVTLKEGETYTASVKTIDGYTNTSKPDNETITIGRTDIELVYEYKKTTGGVDVRYIDQSTQSELVDSEHIDGLEGASYTTSAKTIDGYELVVTPSNASGTMTVDTITVIYEYRKLSTVTVKHIDLNTNAVLVTDSQTLKEAESYTASVKTIDGYQNVSKPESETVTIGRTDVELTYGYRKTTAGVDVRYLDQVTQNALISTEHLDGLEGITYATSAKDIEGYELVVTPSNANGTYTVDKITVTYEYRKLSTLTIKHIDENTGAVLDTETVTLKEGDTYTANAKSIEGYVNTSTPDSESITIERTDIEIVYGYKKTTGGVNIRYIDQVTGTDIVSPEHLDGVEGTAYTSASKTIDGYELVATPDNASGNMTVDTITVTYEYRKLSTLTINHIDANSGTVLDTQEVILKEGDTYTATAKYMDGYTNTSTPENETITMGRENIELVYEYKKTTGGVNVRYIDQVTGEDIVSPEHLDGVEGTTYTTSAKDIEGYELVVTPSNGSGTMTVDAITVTYEYRKLSTVTVKHIDSISKTVLDTEETILKEGESYTSSVKTFDGYQNTLKPDSETITVGNTDIELTYGYTRISAGVDVKYVEQETGAELVTGEHIDGLEGDLYSTAAKTIKGYDLVKTPSNANGTMAVDVITVTYEYVVSEGTIAVTKVDKKDNTILLSGATIRIEKLTADGDVDTTFTAIEKTTDSTGKIVFDNLTLGKYRLTEIKAPEGYSLKSSVTEVELTTDDREINVIEENSLKLQLPKTGNVDYTMIIITMGLLLIIIAIILKKAKRERS